MLSNSEIKRYIEKLDDDKLKSKFLKAFNHLEALQKSVKEHQAMLIFSRYCLKVALRKLVEGK
ncbi:MAG: hypothetical protein ACFFA1_07180 [Promethearchaeota archaeon]